MTTIEDENETVFQEWKDNLSTEEEHELMEHFCTNLMFDEFMNYMHIYFNREVLPNS